MATAKGSSGSNSSAKASPKAAAMAKLMQGKLTAPQGAKKRKAKGSK